MVLIQQMKLQVLDKILTVLNDDLDDYQNNEVKFTVLNLCSDVSNDDQFKYIYN